MSSLAQLHYLQVTMAAKKSSVNGSRWPPLALNSDFTISELEYATRLRRRKGAAGPDGVTYHGVEKP